MKSYFVSLFPVLCGIFFCFFLSSCFTGVEGTSKINLSKKDMIAVMPSEEDNFLSSVAPSFLRDWKEGKEFYVADEKLKLIFETEPNTSVNVGDTLCFFNVVSASGPGGNENTILVFQNHGHFLKYTLEAPLNESSLNLLSSEVPMLLDLELIDKVKPLIVGKRLWTRTANWYDDSLNFKKGKKFVPVVVEDIIPGNAYFPIIVSFSDTSGNSGKLFMNIGSSGNESRNFGKLFSLSDPKQKFKNISEENWEAIQGEKVRNGMTKEEVKLSLGNPSEVETGHNYSNALEIWYYPNGIYLQFVDGILING